MSAAVIMLLYVFGCIGAFAALLNTFRRKARNIREDVQFVVSVVAFSWIGLLSVLIANKTVYKSWWKV